MQATISKSSSPIWRAIVAGHEALAAGMIKRVGDGSTVSVWEDKWIPGSGLLDYPLCFSRPTAQFNMLMS